MRTLLIFLLLFVTQSLHAQKPDFFRVYDSRGKKVAKGNIFTYSDTSITLTRRNRFFETPLSQINVIKHKRTTGHRIAIATLSVAGVAFIVGGAVYAISRSANWTLGPGEGRRPNKAAAPKNLQKLKSPLEKPPKLRKKYKVNGDPGKWEETRKALYYYIL